MPQRRLAAGHAQVSRRPGRRPQFLTMMLSISTCRQDELLYRARVGGHHDVRSRHAPMIATPPAFKQTRWPARHTAVIGRYDFEEFARSEIGAPRGENISRDNFMGAIRVFAYSASAHGRRNA